MFPSTNSSFLLRNSKIHDHMAEKFDAGNNNRQKEAGSCSSTNWDPTMSSVHQFIPNIAKDYLKIANEELNQLKNRFPTSIQPPKESTNHSTYGVQNLYQKGTWDVDHHPSTFNELTSLMNPGFYNSDLHLEMEYTGYISDPEAFDGRIVPPDSSLHSVPHSPGDNIYQQHSFHQCEYQSCNDLNICKEPRKRKLDLLEIPNNESWSGTGSLMDVVTSCRNSNTGDRFSQESFASLAQQCLPLHLPPLEQVPDDSVHGKDVLEVKQLSATLADSFTASQIKEHLSSFIQNNKGISRNRTLIVGQNQCQLCFNDKVLLAPEPIYCSSCDSRIKQSDRYYRSPDENTNTQHSFCKSCFKGSRGSIISKRGVSISKAKLHEAMHDDENEDLSVQCARCSNWQHRICGLYNNEIDEEEKAEYVCPKCCLKEIENRLRIQSPKTVLEAKDLPRTNLSDHIEQRLFRLLKQERQETARLNRIELENVPEAEGLVVRVVVSVDKELEVKQPFRDIFGGHDYPEKLHYRSKRRESVDLCLFGMYVQEYGSECDGPNKRCVYISYLDSVKYFQPERKTHTGESLRTFVYHEILIGYLEHCKKRGFATCYIWACPLQEGEDYIFYCHPETQKTPKQDKLRQWYKLMISKAADDGIVMDNTNLYNQFFNPTKRRNIKISAVNLPYFDGDYWSEAAETISKKLEGVTGGSCSKLPKRRNLMDTQQNNPTKDAVVMQKLGEKILPWKENLIILRLQNMCTRCHEVILSGVRWFCNQCNKIQLCSRCFHDDKLHFKSKMHTCHSDKRSRFSEVVVSDVPLDTKDKDDVIVNNFFETRENFLNKCQKSLLQFNTLAHAKHSSMMILYHFTRNLALQQKTDTCHTHNLTRPSTETTWEPKDEQPSFVMQTNRSVDVLAHSSRCNSECPYPGCRIVKVLLEHASTCRVRAHNGCIYCKQTWLVLWRHSHICTDSGCGLIHLK